MNSGFSVRPAAVEDMDAILAIQTVTHPAFQEDGAVFAERLALYPQGFFVVLRGTVICGYAISHPWLRSSLPAINVLVGALPAEGDTYYIHDVSLLPDARGGKASRMLMEMIRAQALRAGFSVIALTAVGGSDVFWQRHGFVDASNADLARLLSAYGPGAVYMEAPV